MDHEDLRVLHERLASALIEPDGAIDRLEIDTKSRNTPISSIGIPLRSINALRNVGCSVLAHLQGIQANDLLALPHMGEKSAKETFTALKYLPSPLDLLRSDVEVNDTPSEIHVEDAIAEGIRHWRTEDCQPLREFSGLFTYTKTSSLGDLYSYLQAKPSETDLSSFRASITRLVQFVRDASTAAFAKTLVIEEGRCRPPQTSNLQLQQHLAECQSADRELDAILSPFGTRNTDIILQRWECRNGQNQTLESIAAQRGVSRERIRQITDKPRHRLRENAVWLPHTSEAISVLASLGNRWSVQAAIAALEARGVQISERVLRVLPVLAEIGVVPFVQMSRADSLILQQDAIDADDEEKLSESSRTILKQLRFAGWIDRESFDRCGNEEAAVRRRLLPLSLIEIGDAMVLDPPPAVSTTRWVVKLLHVAGAMPFRAVATRIRDFAASSYGQRIQVPMPADEVLEAMVRADSRFVLDKGLLSLRQELMDDDPLTPCERSVIGVLESGSGEATWSEIVEQCVRNMGYPLATVGLVLQGPLLDRPEYGKYELPGTQFVDQAKYRTYEQILTNLTQASILSGVATEQIGPEVMPVPFRRLGREETVDNRQHGAKNMSKTGSASSRGTLTLSAVALMQDRHRVFLTAIRAEDLDAYTRIDHFDPKLPMNDPGQGYQRAEDTPRVKKLGNWLRKQLDEQRGVLMPTAILTSTRNGKLQYDPDRRTITLSKQEKLWVVDGQHRRAGLSYAIHEKGRDDLRAFEVPLVIVEDLSREQEMTQFAVVNGNQKGVRTDLVNMILTQLTSSRGDEAIDEKDQWRVVMSRTVTALNQAINGPWHGMIVMPNEKGWTSAEIEEDPAREHQRVVRATSVMTSLRPIYDYLNANFFAVEELSTVQRAERLTAIVSAFWEAVRDLNPEPFDAAGSYVLQKTPGAFALHRLCARLLPIMHLARREWDAANFRIMLEPIGELSDPQYWDAKSGDASKYGSMKGFAELAELLEESRKDGM